MEFFIFIESPKFENLYSAPYTGSMEFFFESPKFGHDHNKQKDFLGDLVHIRLKMVETLEILVQLEINVFVPILLLS